MAVDKGSESKPDTDPTKYRSHRAERGPLYPGWIHNTTPMMCCYKLATINVKFSLVSGTLESMVEKVTLSIYNFDLFIFSIFVQQQFSTLLEFARKTFVLTDEWYGMTMDDIRDLEDKIKAELDVKIEDFNQNSEANQHF